MTASVASRVTIKASPHQVFKYIADTNYHFLWNPHLQDIKPLAKLELGTKYKTTSWLLGLRVHGKNEVSKYSADKEIEIENNTGTWRYRVRYQLRSQGKSTLLLCTTQVSTDGHAFSFTTPLLRLLARRELQSDLKALKIAVEHHIT